MDALKVGVVGGGVSGLYVALRLKMAGAHPTIFDKGIRLGGRISARTVLKNQIPTSVRSFRSRPDQVPDLRFLFGDGFRQLPESTDGQSAVADRLWEFGAETFDRLSELSADLRPVRGLVSQLAPAPSDRVALRLWGNEPLQPFDAVVLTPPVPQLVQLLHRNEVTVPEELEKIHYSRQLVFIGSGRQATQSGSESQAESSSNFWSHLNVKALEQSDSVTFAGYATNSFSDQIWGQDASVIEAELALAMHRSVTGLEIQDASVKRWRYANALSPAHRDCTQPVDGSLPIWICGDGLGSKPGTDWGISRAIDTAVATFSGLSDTFNLDDPA